MIADGARPGSGRTAFAPLVAELGSSRLHRTPTCGNVGRNAGKRVGEVSGGVKKKNNHRGCALSARVDQTWSWVGGAGSLTCANRWRFRSEAARRGVLGGGSSFSPTLQSQVNEPAEPRFSTGRGDVRARELPRCSSAAIPVLPTPWARGAA